MSLLHNQKNSFTANLYLNGLPVVLNQQRLKQRLRDVRITKRERLDVEVDLADSLESSFITVADHEDDKPLLLKFVPQNVGYSISVVLRGNYDGQYFTTDKDSRNLFVSDIDNAVCFTMRTRKVIGATLADLNPGPAFVEFDSGATNKAVYSFRSSALTLFKDRDPNNTKYDAFNNKPAVFVLKVVDTLPVIA